MVNRKLLITLLCLTATLCITDAQYVSVVTSVLKGIGYLYNAYSNLNDNTEINQELHYRSLKNSIEEVKLKIEQLKSDEADVVNMKIRMYDLQIKSGKIDRLYQLYLKLSSNSSLYDHSTLKEFSKEMTNENVGVHDILYYMHENIVGLNNGSLVDIMERYIEYVNPYCQRLESRQRYFYDLYLSTITNEVKGLLILDYAYKLKEEINGISLMQETKDMHKNFNRRITKTIKTFKDVMARAETEMWMCDNEQVEGKTYAEFKNVFRRIFYNAVEFSEKKEVILCDSYTCPSPTTRTESKCQSKKCNLAQRHCSSVVNCNKLSYEEAYDVCVSKNQDHGRRYSYVRKHNTDWDAVFKDKECDGTFRNALTRPSGPWAGTCNACNCICDETEDSDRFISLKPTTSNLINNFVVTGVQFVMQNHTLYIKIQEGKLLPYGFINSNTAEWKDVEPASDSDDNFYYELNIGLIGDEKVHPKYKTEASDFHFFEGKEKFKIDWFNRRSLYLDDLKLKKNEVVTGVRFAVDHTNTGSVAVKLDIRATPFNYTSGELYVDDTYWLSTFNAPFNREELQLYKYDTPTSYPEVMNKPDNVPHQVTEFAPSAYLSKDAGQTTLPLIDIQPVAGVPAVPLTGISLDIKKSEKSAGYLMLKTTPYNVLWHFDEE